MTLVWHRLGRCVLWTGLLLLGLGGIAEADSPFQDVTLVGPQGTYIITKKGVNVRARPHPEGKRLTSLKRHTIVNVPGRADKTSWYAVQSEGQDLGFVYKTGLAPMIDGSLDSPVRGTVTTNGGDCQFEGTFESRTTEEDVVYSSSDYFFRITCGEGEKEISFGSSLFISEIPFNLGSDPVFQISMDFQEMAADYEEFLSVITRYDARKETLVLDTVTLKQFAGIAKERPSAPATTIREAIAGAVALSLGSIKPKGWDAILQETAQAQGE